MEFSTRSFARLLVVAGLWFGAATPGWGQSGLRFSFDVEGPHGGERETVLRIAGEVNEGDLERLQSFLLRHPREFIAHGDRAVFIVDGGDLEEAIRIGHFLEDALIEAWLPDAARHRCVSACFFMFAAMVSRNAVTDSVGLHRPWFDAGVVARATAAQARTRLDATFARARERLDALQVPCDLIEKMLATPWNETWWLSTDDLARLGGQRHWFEDWSAARCGVEPGLSRRLAYAEAAGYQAEAETLREELTAANSCVADLRKSRRRELVDSLSNQDK